MAGSTLRSDAQLHSRPLETGISQDLSHKILLVADIPKQEFTPLDPCFAAADTGGSNGVKRG